MNEFRNIYKNTFYKNTYIEYDYQTYKNLVLDRINNEDSNDGSIIKEIGKKFIKNVTGQGVNEYKQQKLIKML